MLYLALGILGATVMPHNLYLHSGVVQTRRFGEGVEDRREAIKLATLDSTIALMFALLINASILILAAATFQQSRETRCCGTRSGTCVPGATARLGDRADAVWHSAAMLRAEFHGDRDAVWPDRDGGVYRYSAAGLGAPVDHTRHRHRAGSDRDNLVWREGIRASC